jgi:uncharacterized cupin superfamily protein
LKEASAEETPYGRYIRSDGWFVLNLTEALAVRNEEKGGAVYPLEGEAAPFGDFGVNVRVLWPGEPNGLYHSENGQEGFLVLAGECTLIVEEQERRLKQWDYFHCPPDVPHAIVGAGGGVSLVLAVGNRVGPDVILYPRDETALRHGAGVEQDTPHPNEAYARFTRPTPEVAFREEFLPG